MNDAARELLDFRAGISNLRLKHLPALQAARPAVRLHPPVPDGSVSRAASPEIDAEVIRFAHAFALRLTGRPPPRHRSARAGPGLSAKCSLNVLADGTLLS